VRKVLGGGRTGLTVQFLTETLVLVLFSVVLAMCLVNPMLWLFGEFVPTGVRFKPDWSLAFFLLAITAVTTLLAGYYPARVLSAYEPVASLKGSIEYKGNWVWVLRRILIVFQFTISLVFIIAALVVGNQVRFLLRTDYGFRSDAVLTFRTEWRDSSSKVDVFRNQLASKS
jgi:hypothetical protein